MNFKHGGNIFYYSKKLGKSEKDILDFSVNLNPLNYPEEINSIIIENIDKIYFYPEIYAESLKETIADYLHISKNNILIGNGSTQLIYAIPLSLKIRKALIINPTFSEYRFSLYRSGAKIITYDLSEKDNFNLNIDSFLNFISLINVDAYYLCNPSNPCGTLLDNDQIIFLAKYFRKNNKIFVIDEAFIDFTDSPGIANKVFKHCIVLRSLTKIFGIAGLRLGYCTTDTKTANIIEKYIEPWSINIFSILIGKELVGREDFIKKTKIFVENEMNYVVKELSDIKNIKVFPSKTNYLLIKILNNSNVNQLEQFLLSKNIIIRNCSNFNGLSNKFFRIGIKNRKSNTILIQYLKEFFERECENERVI